MIGSADFDRTRRYRYSLWRSWGDSLFTGQHRHERVCWIMLNPSTADGHVDDPTIRRCIAFSKAWGYGGMRVVNLFAHRATDPDDLLLTADPVGQDTDRVILREVTGAALVVAAWGRLERWNEGRGDQVREMLQKAGAPPLHYLKLTKDGRFPCHPLYLPGELRPTPWR